MKAIKFLLFALVLVPMANCRNDDVESPLLMTEEALCDIEQYAQEIGCHLINTCLVPITDLGTETYLGFGGGLYENGSNIRPISHTQKGIDIAKTIVPIDTTGNPDTSNGKILMASIGLSNTNFEFKEFQKIVDTHEDKDQKLTIVNSAIPGYAIFDWIPETNVKTPSAWDIVHEQYDSLEVSQKQVQIIWLKHTTRNSAFLGGQEKHIDTLTQLYKKLFPILMTEFPNLKMAYMSSRTRAYSFDPATTDPEPYAYGSGFSVKSIVMGQINGDPDLNYDNQKGDVRAPWISWGPYLWANGEPRNDGFTWQCQDTKDDFMHPSNDYGSPKIARLLFDFFTTDETSIIWYFD
ncbi:hypothetical protein [Aquimarina sediminis]|uniref:hypothetical protein n=1 Tax=Aquimarina sediminis TaxID=2070536 RepID=UPI000FFE3DD6|nr:hypothetical protein [Aquimarina sediminis]